MNYSSFNSGRFRQIQDGGPRIMGGRCPFGQIPFLELSDGRKISQSRAILRFVAKEHGVSPSSNYEQARADMLVDALKDMEDKLGALYWERNEERKATLKSKFYDENLPAQVQFLDKILQENNGGKGYFVGDKLSYADISFFCFFNGWIGGGQLEVPEQLKNFPLLVDLYNKVMNEPKILNYLKNRKPNPGTFPY